MNAYFFAGLYVLMACVEGYLLVLIVNLLRSRFRLRVALRKTHTRWGWIAVISAGLIRYSLFFLGLVPATVSLDAMILWML